MQNELWVPEPLDLADWDFECELEWTPKAKGRPRFTKTGHTYTEPATRKAEAALAAQWREDPFDGPLHVGLDLFNDHVTVRIAQLADDYRNRKLRADTDNYVKLIWDALNEKAYHDDRQIVALTARKV